VTTSACCDCEGDSPPCPSSRTNAAACGVRSAQLSLAATLKALVPGLCPHGAVEASCGWHHTTHNKEAFCPRASTSTADATITRTHQYSSRIACATISQH